MLDELVASPGDDDIGGFPPHPHRGIQTLTYVVHGGLRHEDHLGHHSSIGAGGAQWMHTGHGIIHGETPFTDAEGLHAFQLWINLPAHDKLSEPTYRDVSPDEMPRHRAPGVELIALGGTWRTSGGDTLEGPLDALAGKVPWRTCASTPGLPVAREPCHTVAGIRFRRQPDGQWRHPRARRTCQLRPGRHPDAARHRQGQVLLLAGEPHQEPIAHHGPFVMNHTHELEQAMRDYRDGTLTHSPNEQGLANGQ